MRGNHEALGGAGAGGLKGPGWVLCGETSELIKERGRGVGDNRDGKSWDAGNGL